MRGSHFAGLSAFVAVAEQGSFTRAARQLGLSTATLSQTVRGLEERLGIRLLNQTTRNVAPTDAGERLLRQLRPLLDRFDSAVELVNALRDKPAGHLRLTVTPPVARLVLPAVLARFLTQYPEISIEISVSSALTNIVAGRFDAGVRRGRTIARDMIAVRITNDMRPVVIASPDYLARHGTPPLLTICTHTTAFGYAYRMGGFGPGSLLLRARSSNLRLKDPSSSMTPT